MFLKSTRAQLTSTEQGSSLLAVIGLMAIAGIATLAIAGSTLTSVGVTSATRAGVQAQAAAEAGIDAGVLRLSTECSSAEHSSFDTSDPTASVNIFNFESGDWVIGCPTTTGEVKIESTGTATDLGVGGNSTGNERKVEAVYKFTGATDEIPAVTTPPLSFDCWTAKVNSTSSGKVDYGLQITISSDVGAPIVCALQRIKGILKELKLKDVPTLLTLGSPLVVKAKADECSAEAIQDLANKLPKPGILSGLLGASAVIDARACAVGVSLSGSSNSLVIHGNVEIWAIGFSVAPGFTVQGAGGPDLTLITDYVDPTGDGLAIQLSGDGWKTPIAVAVNLGFGTPGTVTPGVPATEAKLGARISIRDLNG